MGLTVAGERGVLADFRPEQAIQWRRNFYMQGGL